MRKQISREALGRRAQSEKPRLQESIGQYNGDCQSVGQHQVKSRTVDTVYRHQYWIRGVVVSLSGILLNTPPNDSERALDKTQYTLTELISNCNYYTDKTSVWLMKYANNTFYKSMAFCVRSNRTHHTQKQAVSDQQDMIQTPSQIWDFCEMPQKVTYTFKHTVN